MTARAKNLTLLHTALGVRSLYDSVCFCNRCGWCTSACPAYQENPLEPNSPRGRNQAMRLFLEGKLKGKEHRAALRALLTSCSLCGKCIRVCPGQIPTPKHMLEFRRLLNFQLLPVSLFYLLRLRGTAPRLFNFMVHTGLWANRLKMLSLFAVIPGMGWLKHTCEILPKQTPKPFNAPLQTHPNFIYLPSLEAEFFLPEVAYNSYFLAAKKHRVVVWKNTASGLFEYLYGDIRFAQKTLRSLILRHQYTGNGSLPLLCDNIDVYHFLKQAPQLFEEFPSWQEKAHHFAQHIVFITDILPKRFKNRTRFEKPILLMPSSILESADTALKTAPQILQTLFKKNFVECGYKQDYAIAAGYGFVRGSHANAYQLQAVRTVAQNQAQTVFVLSGLAALELGYSLRRFYPSARVRHIADLNG